MHSVYASEFKPCIAYLEEIKHIHHSNKYLPAGCELWKWEKELKAICFFISVCFCLEVQLFFCKNIYVFYPTDVDQLFNSKSTAKKMTFKNNKLHSYYLSNGLSDIPNSPFLNSRKGWRDRTHYFAKLKLCSIASPN